MKPATMLRLARAFGSVALRRRRSGPRRPEWPLAFEAVVHDLRAMRDRSVGLPIPAQRALWEAAAVPNALANRMTFETATDAPVNATWCSPLGRSHGGPVVLFLHGGAFGFGSLRTHGELVSRIALASGARVLFVDYRLAPEHPFPAAVDDALAAYEHVARRVDPRRIVVAGDSAGGNLTGMTLIRARDAGLPLPAGGVMISPWVDLGWREDHEPDIDDWVSGPWGDAFRDSYLAGHALEEPRASPLRNELRGLPPLLVQMGDAEILAGQIAAFVERARSEGVDVTHDVAPGMIHDWHMLAGIHPPSQDAIDAVGRFVRTRTARRRPLDIQEERC